MLITNAKCLSQPKSIDSIKFNMVFGVNMFQEIIFFSTRKKIHTVWTRYKFLKVSQPIYWGFCKKLYPLPFA